MNGSRQGHQPARAGGCRPTKLPAAETALPTLLSSPAAEGEGKSDAKGGAGAYQASLDLAEPECAAAGGFRSPSMKNRMRLIMPRDKGWLHKVHDPNDCHQDMLQKFFRQCMRDGYYCVLTDAWFLDKYDRDTADV